MDKGIATIINRYIISVLQSKITVEKVYLFGSYATGKSKEHSDIDIAIIYNDSKYNDRFDLQVHLLTIASDIDTRIEPHPINIEDFNFDNPFAYEIMKKGIEIKI